MNIAEVKLFISDLKNSISEFEIKNQESRKSQTNCFAQTKCEMQ